MNKCGSFVHPLNQLKNHKMYHGLDASASDEGYFNVEAVLASRFYKGELQFLVTWKNRKTTSFETLDFVKNSLPYRTYIDNMFRHMEADIELKKEEMIEMLAKRVDAAIALGKDDVKKLLKNYDTYEFEAFQSLFHIIEHEEAFVNRFVELYFLNFISEWLQDLEDSDQEDNDQDDSNRNE